MGKQSSGKMPGNHVANKGSGPAGMVHMAAKAKPSLKTGRNKQSTNRGK